MFTRSPSSEHQRCQTCGQPLPSEKSSRPSWASLQPHTKYVLLLMGIWLVRFMVLGVLQLTTNTGVGLNVWPCGEDVNWLCLMEEKTGTSLPKTLWALDNRNPLSPWWYVLARPLLTAESGYGFFVARRVADLACALSVFILLHRLGRERHGFFAFACALLTLLWNFGSRFDNVIWVFLGALCLSLLSLWAYCKYVDTDRKKGRYLALSLIFYLLAIGTYTLQASAFLPVFVLALFRPPGRPDTLRAWRRRFLRAVGDVALFAGIFAIFLLLWIATSGPWFAMESCSLSLVSRQLKQALQQVLWHESNGKLLRSLASNWKISYLLYVGLGGMAFFAFLVGRIAFGKPWPKCQDGGETHPEGIRSLGGVLGYTAAVIFGISALTVFVESVSPIWFPGTRTPMLEQVLQPLLYGSVLFGVTCFGTRLRTLARILRWAGVSALSAAILLVSLEYNRVQNWTTVHFKRWIVGCVHELDPSVNRPMNIVIKLNTMGGRPYDPVITRHYIQQVFHARGLNVVLLQKRTPVSAWLGTTVASFRPDDQGLYMCAADGKKRLISYSDVILAQNDGKTTLLKSLAAADLEGFEAEFARAQPLAAAELPLMRVYARRLP